MSTIRLRQQEEIREGQSSIQALVDQLREEGFWCQVRLDADNRITAIFFAHPDSINYLQSEMLINPSTSTRPFRGLIELLIQHFNG
jgi:hypothetical protein